MIKQTLKNTRSFIADFYDLFDQIPQDYSFFVFGTHGVELHSLLYYISMMKTTDEKKVLPSSMFTFRRDIDWMGDLITLRFREKMLKETRSPIIGKWGITFDGGVKKRKWIERNFSHKVPAVVLVRDPILALASFANFEIFLQIQKNHKIDFDNLKKYVLNNLMAIVGYKQNIAPLKPYCESILYIDCCELQGKTTFGTLKKIAQFLGVEISQSSDFQKSINSPIQRYFSRVLFLGDTPYYLSSLSRVFLLESYPDYIEKNVFYEIELDIKLLNEYGLKLFAEEKYIKILLTKKSDIEKNLDLEIEKFKNLMKIYNESKITQETIKEWIDSSTGDLIYREVADTPLEIRKTWNSFINKDIFC